MPGLLKIGITSRSPEERRREISSATGVPKEFSVAYEIFTHDAERLEKTIHADLQFVRVNTNREFFKIELAEAISIISKRATEQRLEYNYRYQGVNEVLDSYEAIEILGQLQKKYPQMIREEIKSVRIYQTKLRCYLESMEESGILIEDSALPLCDQTIHRIDLAFIAKNDDPDANELMFNPQKSVALNARIFIEEFDDYSIINCTNLFTREASLLVTEKRLGRISRNIK